MFKRMRLQLTAICALGTAAVLAAMAGASLWFSLDMLEQQAGEAFWGSVNTVLYHLRSQAVIDQEWLSQTEADAGLWIHVQSGQARLQYTRQSPQRAFLTHSAADYAIRELGFSPDHPSGSLEPEILLFTMPLDGESYRVCVASLPRTGGSLLVVLVKDRIREQRTAVMLRVGFVGCVTVSVLLLVLFAWAFSGRAVRPVETAHRRQTEFVSAASHELRAPLSVIELSAGTIRSVPDSGAALSEKIEGECRRMARLISDLLFLARADDGRLEADMEPLSPRVLLLNAMERYEQMAVGRDVQMELDTPDPLPAIHGSGALLEQALSVFMENALRFAPKQGRILLQGYRDKFWLCLSVGDNGPGVPDKQKKAVFQRFYQGDASRSDKEHYGLGLSVAAEIAAVHHGKVSARDSVLGGAEFILMLPCK